MIYETWCCRLEYRRLPVGIGNKQVEFIERIIKLLQRNGCIQLCKRYFCQQQEISYLRGSSTK
jgi:hypothetical protein